MDQYKCVPIYTARRTSILTYKYTDTGRPEYTCVLMYTVRVYPNTSILSVCILIIYLFASLSASIYVFKNTGTVYKYTGTVFCQTIILAYKQYTPVFWDIVLLCIVCFGFGRTGLAPLLTGRLKVVFLQCTAVH